LVICFKKIKNFGVHLFIISLLWAFVSPFLYKGNGTKFDELVFNWTIARYFLSFSMGLIVFYFQKKLKNNMPQFNSVVLIELFTLLLIFIYINIPFQLEFMTFWACAIILVASARSKLSRIMFENKFIIWFGTISYSFYLIHYPMIEVMKYWLIDEPIVQFGSVFGATFVLSYITYVFIERPFINLGRKLLA
jgi:peptidoglycan/LPS O-acetylase OafA/YrhL